MRTTERRAARCAGLALMLGLAASAGDTTAVAARPATADAPDPLARRGYFGAALGPVAPATREAQKLDAPGGTEVLKLLPGSPAEAAGLQPGDVVRAIDGKPVDSPGAAAQRFTQGKAGDRLTLDVVRDAKPRPVAVTLGERPRESNPAFDTIYGSVASKAGPQRTILTRPRTPGRHPALLILPGLGCYSVEGMPGKPSDYQRITDAFTEKGYVTLRVEKPGCGDSAGGPCADVDFLTELDGYRQGLKLLKARDDVDPDRILLFGHSLGGLWAPLLATESKVRGVAVYGTVIKPWFEYEMENRRRQLRLAGTSFADIDRAQRPYATFQHELYLARKSPESIVKEHPELAEASREMMPDGVHVYGRSLEFMRQVANLALPPLWEQIDAHVLAAWGKAEFVSTEADHRELAELINANHPGHGTFAVVEASDHGFARAESPEAAFRAMHSGGPGEFNPAILTTLLDWADRVTKDAGKGKDRDR